MAAVLTVGLVRAFTEVLNAVRAFTRGKTANACVRVCCVEV